MSDFTTSILHFDFIPFFVKHTKELRYDESRYDELRYDELRYDGFWITTSLCDEIHDEI
jgi:hypothetical protein